MKTELKLQAIQLRKQGYSINELSKIIPVSKSTLSVWVQNIPLSEDARRRILQRYSQGQLKSQESIKNRSFARNQALHSWALEFLLGLEITVQIETLLCAMVYFCEGAKCLNSVAFTNSDPDLVRTFISFFRKAFPLNERKFRILMQLHPYHSEVKQRIFWSVVTGIPVQQFQKTYIKPTKGQYKKEGYEGCIMLRYYDASIARKLNIIAKSFMERYN